MGTKWDFPHRRLSLRAAAFQTTKLNAREPDPNNALSNLRLLTPMSGASGVIVRWQSVTGRTYFLERGTDLGAQPPFLPLATGIVGQPGTTTFTDTNALGGEPFFYRVGLQECTVVGSLFLDIGVDIWIQATL